MFSKTDKTGTTPTSGQPQSEPLVANAQGRQQSPAASRGTAGAGGAPSLISNTLTVVGNLKTEGELQIDGHIEGDVHCGALTVGEKAKITGEIVADRIIVHGNVSGRIRARQVQLATTAHVIGDVYHDTLAIEAGAFLEGHCKRNDSAGAKAEPKLSTPKPASAPTSGDKSEAASAS